MDPTARRLVPVLAVAAAALALIWWPAAPPVTTASLEASRGAPSEVGAELVSVRRGDARERVGLAALAVEPGEDAEEPLDLDTCITGQVLPATPGVSGSRFRAVALPRTGPQPLMLTTEGYGRRLADAETYGWRVADCADDGSFVLGPGLDPDVEYVVVAAGAGECAVGPWSGRWRAGDHVQVETRAVLGIEVRVVDEAGRRWTGPDGLEPGGRGIAVSIHCPEVQRNRHAVPTNLGLAMLGLPKWNGPDGFFRWVLDLDQDGVAGAEATLITPRFVDRWKREVTLRPVAEGVKVETVVLPGAHREESEVVLHLPEGLANDLAKLPSGASFATYLEFQGIDVDGRGVALGFEPRLKPGDRTWTTRGIPPGRYRVTFGTVCNHWIELTHDPGGAPTAVNRELEVFAAGPTHLYLPPLSHALVRLGRVFEGERADQEIMSAQVLGGRLTGYGVLYQGVDTIALLWREDPTNAREWRFETQLADGLHALVDDDGEGRFVLASGDVLDLTLGPRTGPLPTFDDVTGD